MTHSSHPEVENGVRRLTSTMMVRCTTNTTQLILKSKPAEQTRFHYPDTRGLAE